MANIKGYGGDDFGTDEGKYHDRMIGHHEKIKTSPKLKLAKDGPSWTDHDIAQLAHAHARDAHENAAAGEDVIHKDAAELAGDAADGLTRIANHISTRLGVHDEPIKKSSVRDEISKATNDAERRDKRNEDCAKTEERH